MTSIFLFPGQGSQKVGMGEGLCAAFPQETAFADAIPGCSIEEVGPGRVRTGLPAKARQERAVS